MLGLGESCSRCKSNGGIVFDSVAKKISCSECGVDLGLFNDITEPSNGSSDDFLSLKLGNSQHCGSDPVSIATTDQMDTCSGSDDENVQNPSFDPLSTATTKPNKASSGHVTIAAISDRSGLLETVKNRAIEISEKAKKQGSRSRNVLFAACIFIACRQNDIALTIDEISSVADGASVSLTRKAIYSIADKLGIQLDTLMPIRAAEFAKRFCSTLRMDSQDVRAAQEAAEAYPHFVDCSRSPLSVAAVIVYDIARVSYEKRLLKEIMDATGVSEHTIKGTYKDLYSYLSTITPKWFANARDMEKRGSP